MKNGEAIFSEDPIKTAQKLLVDTAMKQPTDPNRVSISAYLNGLMTSVRVDALVTFTTTDQYAEKSPDERYHQILLEAFARYTQLVIDAQVSASRIQVASKIALNG